MLMYNTALFLLKRNAYSRVGTVDRKRSSSISFLILVSSTHSPSWFFPKSSEFPKEQSSIQPYWNRCRNFQAPGFILLKALLIHPLRIFAVSILVVRNSPREKIVKISTESSWFLGRAILRDSLVVARESKRYEFSLRHCLTTFPLKLFSLFLLFCSCIKIWRGCSTRSQVCRSFMRHWIFLFWLNLFHFRIIKENV